MEADTSDYTKTMKVLGSPENALFYEYQRYALDMHDKIAPVERG